MSSSKLRRIVPLASLSLPVIIWFKDTAYSTCRVNGDSMSPSLKDGDIVLVRKADISPYLNRFRNKNDINLDDIDYSDDDVISHIVNRIDVHCGKRPVWIFSQPPTALPGEIVVFKSPNIFPCDFRVSRVTALGGQMVRPVDRKRSILKIPQYSLWLEADNRENCEDTCHDGSVSKKMVVGLAEKIIWPPWRWGTIERKRPALGRAWWL